MAFFTRALDAASDAASKLGGLVDNAQEAAAGRVVRYLEPLVYRQIDTRVDEFRDATLQELPTRCEQGLESRTDSNAVAWVFNRVLGNKTDVLVGKLVERFRPGIVAATDGLSSNATQKILGELRNILNVENAGQPAGQDYVPEGPAPTGTTEAELPAQLGGQDDQAGPHGFRHAALALASSVAGGALNIEDRLPGYEALARELVHPLFAQLKGQIWELVPSVLQDVLGDLVGDKQHEAEGDPGAAGVAADSAGPDLSARGFSRWVQSRLAGRAGQVCDAVLAAALDTLDGPLQDIINRLVDELESSATAAAFRQVREKLAEYSIISSPDIAAS